MNKALIKSPPGTIYGVGEGAERTQAVIRETEREVKEGSGRHQRGVAIPEAGMRREKNEIKAEESRQDHGPGVGPLLRLRHMPLPH